MNKLYLRSLPQAVIFDWDNTLVENWAVLTAAMNEALKKFSLPVWDEERMRANSRLSMRNSFPAIFGDEWEKARDIFYTHFRQNHLQGLHALPQAKELLQLLHNHGVRLAICSNKNGDLLRREVRHIGWGEHFSHVVGAQDTEKDKPDILPARLIMQAGNLKAGRHIWFVGDTASDMICANRAGLLAFGVGPHASENPEYLPHLWANDLHSILTELTHLLSSAHE